MPLREQPRQTGQDSKCGPEGQENKQGHDHRPIHGVFMVFTEASGSGWQTVTSDRMTANPRPLARPVLFRGRMQVATAVYCAAALSTATPERSVPRTALVSIRIFVATALAFVSHGEQPFGSKQASNRAGI